MPAHDCRPARLIESTSQCQACYRGILIEHVVGGYLLDTLPLRGVRFRGPYLDLVHAIGQEVADDGLQLALVDRLRCELRVLLLARAQVRQRGLGLVVLVGDEQCILAVHTIEGLRASIVQ